MVPNGRIESPEIDPHIYGKLIFTRVLRLFNDESIVFPTNGAGTIGYPGGKESSWIPTKYHIQKFT